MDFMQLTKARKKYLRMSSSVYDEIESKHYVLPPGETDFHDCWVTARFSPHQSQDHILLMGDDPGNIGVYDVRKFHDRSAPLEERQLHFFPAHDGAIMDVVGVPQNESRIVSISGDSTIRCWDLNKTPQDWTSMLFYGHERSLRSICFAPNDPNIFVTCARDGHVKLWDMRVSAVKKNEIECRMATATYHMAHPTSKGEESSTGTPKSKSKVKLTGSSVTSVLFLDEFHFASASSDIESGIRVWDIRKPTRNKKDVPVRILNVPSSKQRSYGITCMAMDRFGNRLFAACTNSTVFEYSIPSGSTTPINSYNGATVRDFYTQVACSPVSDTIVCGSDDNRALIWDLQDQYSYMNDLTLSDGIDKRRTQFPRWSCGGHLSKVLNVGWSSRGTHLMTFDERGVRIWSEPRQRKPWKCCEDEADYPAASQDLGLEYECAVKYQMAESDAAMSSIDSMSLSPRQRADSGLIGSPRKRASKRPIVESPFKSICSSPKPFRLNQSPMKKLFKLSSSPSNLPLQPTNVDQGYNTPRHRSKKRNNPFYYEHPTEKLPNFVYDMFVKKIYKKSDTECSEKSLSKTSRKRLEDWWEEKGAENVSTTNRARLPSVSEFGESACSKVISEDERIALLSPRKLVLLRNKISTSSPCTSSSAPFIPKTPCKPGNRRPTSRNLFHYFKSTPPSTPQ